MSTQSWKCQFGLRDKDQITTFGLDLSNLKHGMSDFDMMVKIM
jgi:hypothetical protein